MLTSPRSSRRALGLSLLGPVLFALAPSHGFAAYEEYLVNDDTFGQESRIDPVVVPLDDGSFLFLWEDNGRGHTDLLARPVSAALEPMGEAFYVNHEDGYFQHRDLDVSVPKGGTFATVWTDDRLGERRVFARTFASEDGTPNASSEVRVSVELGFGATYTPAVATNAVGKSLVVWTAQQSGAGHVYGQLLTAQGAREAANLDLVPSVVGRHQSNPSVASLPDGRWILTWTEEDESRDENVFYRFLAANGTPTGTVRQANTDIFSDVPQQNPAVMVLDDKMLVVWSDGRTSTLDAWGRWFDFDGEPLGSESLLREAADSPGDLDPRAIRGTGDGFAVQWFGGIDNRQRMMTRFFNADGTGRTDSFAFDDPIFGVLMRGGRLAPAADGKWIATWSDNRTFAFDCYAREIDATGNAGPVHTIYSRPKSASQIYGDIAMFPDGRAVVVWSDMQYGSLTIFGRFLDETGQPVGSSFQVSGVPANALFDTVDSIEGLADYSPAVSASADGFVVTWAINQEGGRLNAFAQYYRPDGNPVGGNFRIAPDAITSLQRSPRPAMIPGGGFVIVLEISNANNGGDVFLQRYAADGLPIGNRINCADSTPAAQIDPDVAVSPFGEILVTWVDRRGGGWDIWSQRFSANGDRIGSNVSLHGEDEPFSDQLRPSGAIAGDRTITVWETRPNLDGLVEARLEIFPTFGPDGSTQRRGEIRTFLVNADRVAKGAKYPQAAMAPNGNFIITFWDNSSGQTDLVVQRYDPDGNPMGDSYSMHGTGTDGSRLDPKLEVT
ncbi:MAG: hypothetical protein KC729_18215, partial [Candidatus Eisenbacteria bacterium]|nr:hypothetical protein [Candidatus Eisenbacteria bacterium]